MPLCLCANEFICILYKENREHRIKYWAFSRPVALLDEHDDCASLRTIHTTHNTHPIDLTRVHNVQNDYGVEQKFKWRYTQKSKITILILVNFDCFIILSMLLHRQSPEKPI